jgi:Retrotransposon gag protein/Retroviral aspartyl protease/Zinc knuckle
MSASSDLQMKNLIEGMKALQIANEKIEERLESTERKGKYKLGKPEPFKGDPTKLQGFLPRMDLELNHWGLSEGPEHEKVKFTGTYIQEEAGEWYEPILRDYLTNDEEDREDRTNEIFGNYNKLKEYMKKAFGDLNEKLASERRIRECRQKTSVWKYNTEFNQIISHLDWDDDARMAQYRTGLKPEVRDAMIYFERDARNLDQLMERAQLVDRRMWDSRMERRLDKTIGLHPMRNGGKTKREIKYDRDGDVKMIGARAIDKSECRKKKLCFNCGKPNHQAKNCRNRGKIQKSDSEKTAEKPIQSRMAIVGGKEDQQRESTEKQDAQEGESRRDEGTFNAIKETEYQDRSLDWSSPDSGRYDSPNDDPFRDIGWEHEGDAHYRDEHYDPEGFHQNLSEQQKVEWRTASKIGITTELEELWWHQFNAEEPTMLKREEAEEKVKEMGWVKEMIYDKINADRKRKNNRRMCKQVCTGALRENLPYCLCFCGKHREECPVHRVVEPMRPRVAKSNDETRNEPDESRNDDDGGRTTSEKKKPDYEQVREKWIQERQKRTIDKTGGQKRGQKLSEFLRKIDERAESEDNRQEKGRLQDDISSELHDSESQKHSTSHATTRLELADKRSTKETAVERPASEELERNTQRLRPVPRLARREATIYGWRESQTIQYKSKPRSAGSKRFDQWYQQWTREQRLHPLGSEGWFNECWQRDNEQCDCYGWNQKCWAQTSDQWREHTAKCEHCSQWEDRKCGVKTHLVKRTMLSEPSIYQKHGEREVPWWACVDDKCEEHIRQKNKNGVYPMMPRIVKRDARGHPSYQKKHETSLQVRGHETSDKNRARYHPKNMKKTRPAYCLMVQEKRKGPVIQVGVILDKRRIEALIDSGSTENFISETVMQEINAQIKTRGTITIERFDGTEAEYESKTATLRYRIEDREFQDEFKIIPMGTGCEVILGIPWLEKNNPRIDWQKRTILLKGAQLSEGKKRIEGNSLARQGAMMQPSHEAVSGHSDKSQRDQPKGPQRKNDHTRETSEFEYEVPQAEYEKRLEEVRRVLPDHYREFEGVFCPRK